MASKGTVALGVTGSIAAYKAADLTSKLVQAGVEVQVLMTKSATQLVQPQTFFTLSQQPVITDLWEMPAWQPGHIALAERADLLVIAPATANIIGKIAHGIADDALTTCALSHTGPILLVPAMNPRMWKNAAVRANCTILRQRGIEIMEPETGRVACGDEGQGRFPEVSRILARILETLAAAKAPAVNSKLPKILVTAGPTREAVDPVRYISNHSSGKMGYAIAAAAGAAGCATTLVSGPVDLATPSGCRRLDVITAAEMKNAVQQEFPQHDILVMCAAVADYRPARPAKKKLHKEEGGMTLEMERTDDILLSLKGKKKRTQRIMGFAAETNDLEASALGKLKRKNLDWIVANDVSRRDIGFGADQNEVTIYAADGTVTRLPKASKAEIAAALVKLLIEASPCRK
jgi:phosphopantothenoylcysteine decarboxylase/phosphopantothenate--cysteine ligase